MVKPREKVSKRLCLALLMILSATALETFVICLPVVASAEELTPSSVPKLYRGPDGERITMLEVNASSQMLVRFEGVGGKWEGTTQLWSLEAVGSDRKNVYFQTVVDGSPRRYTALVFLAGGWFAYLPERANRSIDLRYSAAESKDLKAESLIGSRTKTNNTDGGKS
jgi:hypothetical protein